MWRLSALLSLAVNRSLDSFPRPPFWSTNVFDRAAVEARWRATIGQGDDVCSPCRGWAISTLCRMSQRYTFFHRITDCMMVYFSRVALAHTLLTEAATDEETVVCLVGESAQTYGAAIVPYLLDGMAVGTSQTVANASYAVPRRDGRNSTLLIFHGRPRGCAAPIELVPASLDHWRTSKTNARAPSHGELARAMVGRLRPPLPVDLTAAVGRATVLIARPGSRQWEESSRMALEDALGRACGSSTAPDQDGGQLRTYRGTESMAATLRLFRSAAAVVGVHGAGFANAIFSVATVVEVTMYVDSNHSRHWRCNGPERGCGSLNMQPWLDARTKYVVHAVSIEPTLQANSNIALSGGPQDGLKPCAANVDRRQKKTSCYWAPWNLSTGSLPSGDHHSTLDHLLKYLRVVRLLSSDVAAVASHARRPFCRSGHL